MQKMKQQNLVESRKSKVKSQEPRAKRRKTKIVKWEYVTKPFDVHVDPDTVNRVHAPLGRSLSFLLRKSLPLRYPNGEFYLHLRPCVQGVDENGVVIKYLYCTRDGRFFVRGKDGWNEILPININRHSKSPACGGSYDCPQLRDYGWKPAHRCVAFAWLDVPEDVKLQSAGVDAPTKWEVDHLDTNHKNWTADNLQWVTAEENRRRGKIARRMRKIGLDPKLLSPTLLRGIYSLPDKDDWVGVFIGIFTDVCSNDPSPLSAEAIRLDVAKVLDVLKKYISEGKGLPLLLTKEQLNDLGL